MLFQKVPLPALIQWCRALKHGLHVGLSPVRVFRQQAKSGPHQVRQLAGQLADRLEKGDSLADAVKPFKDRFPPLFLALLTVGEHAGRLSETFGEMETYFETVLAARKEFYRALIWPGIMYVGAILTIAIMLLVLGLIGGQFDPLGLGLLGPSGAMTWLLAAGLFTAAVVGAFFFIRENDLIRGKIEAFALRVPALGGCFRAFALQRFSMALHMTSEAGLRADKALVHSFRATANEAYTRHAEPAAKKARSGERVADILAECGPVVFPDEYLDAVQVGETSGQLAEVMQKQAEYYRAEATRKLKVLTMLAGGAVYAMVGVFLIVLIFKIISTAYLGPLNDAQKAADNPEKWLQGR